MGLFRQLFVWWENATPGTLMTTLFSGNAVGELVWRLPLADSYDRAINSDAAKGMAMQCNT